MWPCSAIEKRTSLYSRSHSGGAAAASKLANVRRPQNSSASTRWLRSTELDAVNVCVLEDCGATLDLPAVWLADRSVDHWETPFLSVGLSHPVWGPIPKGILHWAEFGEKDLGGALVHPADSVEPGERLGEGHHGAIDLGTRSPLMPATRTPAVTVFLCTSRPTHRSSTRSKATPPRKECARRSQERACHAFARRARGNNAGCRKLPRQFICGLAIPMPGADGSERSG